MNKWTFGPTKDDMQTYADGTVVPHRYMRVYCNSKIVGYIEVHMHKNKGIDGNIVPSFGITAVVERMPEGVASNK